MSDEVRGNLNTDITCLNDNEKAQLVQLSVKSSNELMEKKRNSRSPKNTTLELIEINGYQYKVTARKVEEVKNPTATATTEDKIKSLGLDQKVTEKILEKYKNAEINTNHVRDISKVNLGQDISNLDSQSQDRITETIITNRNEQNLINSEETIINVIQAGTINKFIADTWYRGILRFIKKLFDMADVNERVLSELSPQQRANLNSKLTKLVRRLERLISLLGNSSSKTA